MGSSAGHGTNGHAADQINKLKSKALAQFIKVIVHRNNRGVMLHTQAVQQNTSIVHVMLKKNTNLIVFTVLKRSQWASFQDYFCKCLFEMAFFSRLSPLQQGFFLRFYCV